MNHDAYVFMNFGVIYRAFEKTKTYSKTEWYKN